jgi:hypothetical protein
MHLSAAFLFALLPAFTTAHGYLSSPPPRGIEKASTDVDALKSPNFSHKVCRGEPEGQITQVKMGGSITLQFTITAPHIGPCNVYLLDTDLDVSKQVPVASKMDCAAPGKVEPWTIKLPIGEMGRKVLRWTWEGQHIGIPGEPYEQCVDLMIGSVNITPGGGLQVMHLNDGYQGPPPPKVPSYAGAPPALPSPPRAPLPPPPMNAVPAQPTYGEAHAADSQPDTGYSAADAPQEDSAAPEDAYPSDAAPTAGPGHGDAAGACQNGRYQCNPDGSFSVCDAGRLVVQQCGPSQVCQPSNGSILCVLASAAPGY